ncbi:MAG: hypothetical protein VBE63_23915, partial [Lamprobacter sp.]|uniref:hypothetical protein n=1 Tax=Lamprobacter sp. TaxID=3100796 RepID=UPI002B262812
PFVSVLLRAIDALEGQPAPEPSLSLGDSLAERLGSIEQRLSALEKAPRRWAAQQPFERPPSANEAAKAPFTNEQSVSTAADQPDRPKQASNAGRNTRYSDADRRHAIEMKQQGFSRAEIADALEQRTGRRPNPHSIPTQIKTWARQFAERDNQAEQGELGAL